MITKNQNLNFNKFMRYYSACMNSLSSYVYKESKWDGFVKCSTKTR